MSKAHNEQAVIPSPTTLRLTHNEITARISLQSVRHFYMHIKMADRRRWNLRQLAPVLAGKEP